MLFDVYCTMYTVQCTSNNILAGITYSGLWINDGIPPEELPFQMVVVGTTEVEIFQGESFDIGQYIQYTLYTIQ